MFPTGPGRFRRNPRGLGVCGVTETFRNREKKVRRGGGGKGGVERNVYITERGKMVVIYE